MKYVFAFGYPDPDGSLCPYPLQILFQGSSSQNFISRPKHEYPPTYRPQQAQPFLLRIVASLHFQHKNESWACRTTETVSRPGDLPGELLKNSGLT